MRRVESGTSGVRWLGQSTTSEDLAREASLNPFNCVAEPDFSRVPHLCSVFENGSDAHRVNQCSWRDARAQPRTEIPGNRHSLSRVACSRSADFSCRLSPLTVSRSARPSLGERRREERGDASLLRRTFGHFCAQVRVTPMDV